MAPNALHRVGDPVYRGRRLLLRDSFSAVLHPGTRHLRRPGGRAVVRVGHVRTGNLDGDHGAHLGCDLRSVRAEADGDAGLFRRRGGAHADGLRHQRTAVADPARPAGHAHGHDVRHHGVGGQPGAQGAQRLGARLAADRAVPRRLARSASGRRVGRCTRLSLELLHHGRTAGVVRPAGSAVRSRGVRPCHRHGAAEPAGVPARPRAGAVVRRIGHHIGEPYPAPHRHPHAGPDPAALGPVAAALG